MRNLKIDIICTTFTKKKKGGDALIKCEQKHLGNLISKIFLKNPVFYRTKGFMYILPGSTVTVCERGL